MDNPRDVRFDGSKYPVIEIFTSVQFEGARCGVSSHFLRLGGCNLNCRFCDTDLKAFKMMTPAEIADQLFEMNRYSPLDRLVITGGEPLVHDLTLLFQALGEKFYIAVESNGTMIEEVRACQPQVLNRINWLTVSPKTFLPPKAYDYVDEFKFIIPDHEHLMAKAPITTQPVFIQPEFSNPNAMPRCIQLLSENPNLRLSIQTHKFVGMR